MENQEIFIKKLLELMGFKDFRVEVEGEPERGLVFIYDEPALIKENLPVLIQDFNQLIRLLAKRLNQPAVFFDVNNYRKEREGLIVELARAAAKKVLATGENISLPAMNSYERRLIHSALAVHPEVTTESVGVSRDRYVIVKLIRENQIKTLSESADSKTEPPLLS